ncbi:MAG TPA: DoxX family protein [Cyclobacteriaceae bacterium]|nr:DoxX family protein [Cyclobacteriaceae bacterium]
MKLHNIFFGKPDGSYIQVMLLLLRIGSGSFLLTHGIPKFKKLMAGGEIKFSDPIGLGPEVSLILAVFTEVVCTSMIILGLGTRIAAFIGIGFMSIISFIVHGPDPFGRKELPLMYLMIFLVLLIFGGGKYSIDHLLGRNSGPLSKE